MDDFKALRDAAPACYPDHALYARYTAERSGLVFRDHDQGSGLVFSVSNDRKSIFFGGGKCPAYPQNNSTSAYLATDKYFANRILSEFQIPNLGGRYFFLHDRFKLLREPGHEVSDAVAYVKSLGGRCFVKPLSGSRGDFAQAIDSAESFRAYLDEVRKYHDSIIVQTTGNGREYRVFVQDGAVIYSSRKLVPQLQGDGIHTISSLLAQMNDALSAKGISAAPAAQALPGGLSLDTVLEDGQIVALPGRANMSAGGTMILEDPPHRHDVFSLALRSADVLGLRAAGVDIFVDERDGKPDLKVIEVNSNPSIRLLENAGRLDITERIWRGTLAAMGLIDG